VEANLNQIQCGQLERVFHEQEFGKYSHVGRKMTQRDGREDYLPGILTHNKTEMMKTIQHRLAANKIALCTVIVSSDANKALELFKDQWKSAVIVLKDDENPQGVATVTAKGFSVDKQDDAFMALMFGLSNAIDWARQDKTLIELERSVVRLNTSVDWK